MIQVLIKYAGLLQCRLNHYRVSHPRPLESARDPRDNVMIETVLKEEATGTGPMSVLPISAVLMG